MKYIKGTHIATNFQILPKKVAVWEATVLFSNSCKYTTKDKDNQGDWNKLIGIRQEFLGSMKNSAMIVWRHYKERLQMGWYYHDWKGIARYIESNEAIEVKIGVPVFLRLESKLVLWDFSINGTRYFKDKSEMSGGFIEGWCINSWFGGNEVAPQMIEIVFTKNKIV